MKKIIILILTQLFIFTSKATTSEEKIEYHWSVCSESPSQVLQKLDMNLVETNHRNVDYMDTQNELALYHQGVIIRIRQDQKGWYSTVKMTQPNKINQPNPFFLLAKKLSKCEWDRIGTSLVRHCSFNSIVQPDNYPEKIEDALSKEQIKFLDEGKIKVAPHTKQMKHTGAISQTVFKLEDDAGNEITIEETQLGAKENFIEISFRAPLDDNQDEIYKIWSNKFKKLNINLCSLQRSKTESILNKRLR
jgi:hypothetical protein